MKRFLLTGVAFAALAAVAVPASASTMVAQYKGTVGTSLTAQINGSTPHYVVNQFRWEPQGTTDTFKTVCIEIDDFIYTPTTFDVHNAGSVQGAGAGIDATDVANLAKLFNAASSYIDFDGFDISGDGTYTAKTVRGAFQAAVWEILFETTASYDISSGSMYLSSFSSAAETLAETWLSALGSQSTTLTQGGDDYELAYLIATDPAKSQNQLTIIKDGGGVQGFMPFPEPTSLAVWGFLSLGAGGFARRRRAKAAA